MEWIFLALLAPAFWCVSNVFDKFLLDKVVKDSLSYSILMEFLWLVFVVLVALLKPISVNFSFMLWAVAGGMLGMSGYFLYCKAMHLEEASRVLPLTNLTTIFTALIAFLFLGETLVGIQYVGIMMVVAGTILLSYKRNKHTDMASNISVISVDGTVGVKGTSGMRGTNGIRGTVDTIWHELDKWRGADKSKLLHRIPVSPALIFILVQCIFWASSSVVEKYTLSSIDYWSLFVWYALGEVTVTLFVLANSKVRKRLASTRKALKLKKFIPLAFVGETFAFISRMVLLAAFSLGPVSAVSAVTAIGPLYLLAITLALSIFKPKILKEEISKSAVSLKLISILLIFVGVWLITVV